MKRNSCASIISSSLGVAEISDLNLATDLGLNPSYNCWVQMSERLRLRSLSARASANRVEEKLNSSESNKRKLKLAGDAARPH